MDIAAESLDAGDGNSDADDLAVELGSWAHLEVEPTFLREAHPPVVSMTGSDVCLLATAYPDYPIGEGSVGWRAQVQRQRKARVARQVQVQVKLFGHWFDLEGGHVRPICQPRAAAPRASAATAPHKHAAYTWHRLEDLAALRMTEAEQATWRDVRERLQEFPLLGPNGAVECHVDLWRVCSVYESPGGGAAYWLHPELVDERGPAPACLLCHKCANAIQQGLRPAMSVANVDYGWLGRVPELGRLSVLEELLLSPNRLYHVVVKVRQLSLPRCLIVLTRWPRAGTNLVWASRAWLPERRSHLLSARWAGGRSARHRGPRRVDT